MIQGVKIKDLLINVDERGRLFEILRKDEEIFKGFGMVYVTTAYPKVVKAWHYHRLQWDNFTVIKGMAKIVLYDDREDSPTKGEINEIFAGIYKPRLIQIPPMVYHGFKCISEEEVMILNIPTMPYNRQEPDEYRIHPHNNDVIPYDWSRKDG